MSFFRGIFRFLRNVFSQLHTFVLWALLSAIFWGWIFSLATDTSPEKKVTVYCSVPGIRDTELAVRLEEDMPEGLRMIKVHSFDYVMLDVESIDRGDIFIIPASETDTYRDMLLSGGEGGVKVYDAASGTGAAAGYIDYADEDYYLYLGAGSAHLEDGIARRVAEQIVNIQ